LPSKKVLKSRIKSVTTTKQIIKAMDMVAASKLQMYKARLDSARPFYTEAMRIASNLGKCANTQGNVFVSPREVKRAAYIVISSDRGLCGGYNANVSEAALLHMGALAGKPEVKILAVGLRGRDFFRRRGKKIHSVYPDVSETALYEDAVSLGEKLSGMFVSGESDETYLAYTHFNSVLQYTPTIIKLLPIGDGKEPPYVADAMKYETGAAAYVSRAVPMYLSAVLYGALLESASCEQATRMVCMNSATKNAEEIIDGLTLQYNRKRQAYITQEINEIVGGLNIIK